MMQKVEKAQKRVGLKLLQCNDEMCQYELRPDGDIGWAAQATNTVY